MTADTKQFIENLNNDLAAEWGTILRYTYNSSKVAGFAGEEVRRILAPEITDEIGHATFLSEVIADLGGEPTTEPEAWTKHDDIKSMLEQDLEFEKQATTGYEERAEQAAELGLTELKVKLDEMSADEAGHARELRRVLRGM